jgi:hypothetical protein
MIKTSKCSRGIRRLARFVEHSIVRDVYISGLGACGKFFFAVLADTMDLP